MRKREDKQAKKSTLPAETERVEVKCQSDGTYRSLWLANRYCSRFSRGANYLKSYLHRRRCLGPASVEALARVGAGGNPASLGPDVPLALPLAASDIRRYPESIIILSVTFLW